MRDKYIELIKEYIKVKPGYKSVLDEIKREVTSIGATEEEFEEAIKQIERQDNFILQNTIQPVSRSQNIPKNARIKNLFNSSSRTINKNKKHIAVISLTIVFLFFIGFNFNRQETPKNVTGYQAPLVKTTISKNDSFPVVYASSEKIDVDKIFSIKSNKVKLTISGKPKKEIMGFFPYWMLSKYDKISLDDLTSISLFGLDTDGNGNIVTKTDSGDAQGGWSMWKDPLVDKLIQKARSKDVKVYLTFKSFDSSNIDKLSLSDTAQKNFIANALYLVNSKNLNGINIDFEYQGVPSQLVRDGFTRFITNLNIELKRQIPNSNLTVDTYLSSGSESGLFNIGPLSQNLDAFVIMAYDMHTPLGEPGPVSAMGGDKNIIGYVQNYLEKTDASKLILAVPYYGYDWPKDTSNTTSGDVKILPYAEIADLSSLQKIYWDDDSQTPYYTYKDASGTLRIVHFDNVRSLGIKYDFVNAKNLKGVGIWALGYDGENQDLEKLLIDKFINQ